MKNPMDRQLEKRLAERVVAIGREGETAAFAELLEGLRSSSANVRRLAASALGKLAWLGMAQDQAVTALAFIEEAVKVAAAAVARRCQRCGVVVTAADCRLADGTWHRLSL